MTLPLQPMPSSAVGEARLTVAQLADWMTTCRAQTLALVAGLDRSTFCQQAHPDFSPIGWHLGHIAYTEALWILEHLAGHPPQFPAYRRLFAADSLPKTERQQLPPQAEVVAYLETVRTQVLAYLEPAPWADQERLWRWLLQHESQHGETMAIIQALHRLPHDPIVEAAEPIAGPDPEMIGVPAGAVTIGYESLNAIDNEQPIQRVEVDTYWIDRYPVTCGQYRHFIQAGGYDNPAWWSAAGWAWRQATSVRHPLYWVEDRRYAAHPVCGVSWYEADAYARFVGKRLPTEVEWEKAAVWDPRSLRSQIYPWGHTVPTPTDCNHGHYMGWTTPVTAYPTNQSPVGCRDMLGNVWEWTDSWFAGYPGFVAYPYRGYSEVYFDQAHRVLRGGSWATRSWALRSPLRNWYYPHVREIFAGFRCASDRPIS